MKLGRKGQISWWRGIQFMFVIVIIFLLYNTFFKPIPQVDTSKFDESQQEIAKSLSRIEGNLGSLNREVSNLKVKSADKDSIDKLNKRFDQIEKDISRVEAEINSIDPTVVQEIHNNFFNRYNINLAITVGLTFLGLEFIMYKLVYSKLTRKEKTTVNINEKHSYYPPNYKN